MALAASKTKSEHQRAVAAAAPLAQERRRRFLRKACLGVPCAQVRVSLRMRALRLPRLGCGQGAHCGRSR